MINKRIINNIKKTNEKVAELLSQIDNITDNQLKDILKEIENVKEQKRIAKNKVDEELKTLKENDKKIKESNSKVLKKKEDIGKTLDIVGDTLVDGSKKLKTLSDSTDKLVDKTTQAKKDAMSVMNIFKRKEVINNYNFTFTKTSKITSKGIVFQNTIIKSIVIGNAQQSKISQSNANYDSESVDVETLKLKELKEISKKLDITKVSSSSQTTPSDKKEEKDKSSFDWKKVLTGGGIGAAAIGLGKKALGYGKKAGKVAEAAEPAIATASKFGKFAKVIPLINLPFVINDIKNRVKDSNEKMNGLDASSDYAKGIKGARNIGIAGDVLQGLPVPLLAQALGYGVSKLGDYSMDAAKENYKKQTKEKWDFYDDPNASLKLKVNNSSDMAVSGNYKKFNGTSLKNVSGIKGKKEEGDIDSVQNLLKKNEQYTIDALTGKRKKIIAPKFEVDGKIDVSALKSGKVIKDLAPQLPANLNVESSLTKGKMTTLGGALGSQHRVNSNFMEMRNIKGSGFKPHKGIDIAADMGTEINAPEGGTLTNKSQPDGMGNYVELLTDSGYAVVFGHLSKYSSEKSPRRVERLETIGYSGNSGKRTTGPHIHLQVGKGPGGWFTNPINPSEWLQSLANGDKSSSPISSNVSMPKLNEPKIGNTLDLHYEAGKKIGQTISDRQNKIVLPK